MIDNSFFAFWKQDSEEIREPSNKTQKNPTKFQEANTEKQKLPGSAC